MLDSWFRRPAVWSIAALMILATVVFVVGAANTANNYTGSATGNVTTAGNWSEGHVPNVSEDAVFTSTSNSGIKNFGAGGRLHADLEDKKITYLGGDGNDAVLVPLAVPNFVVTKTDDTNGTCAVGDCSLREAIVAANANADTNTITFDISGAGPHTIQLTSALNNLAENVNINGPADESVTVSGEGSGNPYRIFVINSGKTVTISNLNITNGLAAGSFPDSCGGGIFNNHGTLTLTGNTVYSNTGDFGGGICNFGRGGPIATLTIVNSTISGNTATANQGGGIINDGSNSGSASLTIINSTLTGNSAATGGDGVANYGFNSGSAPFAVRNTIFESSGGENILNAAGTVTSQGHNLSDDDANGDATTGPGGDLNASGDIRNTFPRLGGLADNGGPTLTHGLLPGSPAIEAGDDCVLTGCSGASPVIVTDQRGVARTQGNHVDMGSFELQAYFVTKTADTNGTRLPGDCSLREAIKAANLDSPNVRLILFNIPAGDAGCDVNAVCTITPSPNALPPITNTVFIDGYSQPGSEQNGLDLTGPNPTAGDDAVLKIVLNGTGLPDGSLGIDLHYGSEWSVVRGLVIHNFDGAGVWIENDGSSQVSGNFIGTDAAGTAAAANGDGVVIVYGFFHLIGGDLPSERNVISGNRVNGIRITGDETNGNSVEGNYIGTTKNGDDDLANPVGVYINDDSSGNVIGCEVLNGDNLISGNSSAGVRIEESSYNLVEGNFIGTSKTGTSAIPNIIGVEITDGSYNSVGLPDFGNLISGNTGPGNSGIGLLIQSSPDSSSPSYFNDVQGNRIGTDLTGTGPLANNVGIVIRDASDSLIGGGNETGDRNYISGNTLEGVRIVSSTGSSVGNQLYGNSIGTNVAGTGAIPNGSGVKIIGGSQNEVGCAFTGSGNLISGNTGEGVELTGGAGSNFVQGNLIGVQSDATTALGNGGSGVEVYIGASNNVIGVLPDGGDERSRLDSIAAKTGPCKAQPERGSLRAAKAAASRQARAKTEGTRADGSASNQAAAKRAAAKPVRPVRIRKHSTVGRFAAIAAAFPATKQTTLIGPAIAPLTATENGGNVIAFNVEDGVKISSAGDVNNLISQNSIYSNGKLGINLVGGTESLEGVTDNDPGDGDDGPNYLQNFPEISDAAADTQTIIGTFDSFERGPYTIEVFANVDCDPSGYGEGKTYIASIQINGSTFSVSAPPASFTAGQVLTATATDANGNTSEFSPCFTATPASAGADLYIEKTDSPDPVTIGNALTYTITVSNNGPTAATSVEVTDTLPASVTFVSATPSQGSCSGTTDITCNLGTIGNGGTASVQIVVTAPNTPGSISNSASVSSPDDGLNENNTAGAETQVNACPTTFIVTSTGDEVDAAVGDGHCDTDSGSVGDQCTLRAAIEEANALPACGVITIDATGVNGTISLGMPLPTIIHDVNINGPGASLLTVERGSASTFRVFYVDSFRIVNISGLTIANGSENQGGNVNNQGTTTLTNCIVRGGQASFGGGIYNGSVLKLVNSTVRDNSADYAGGILNVITMNVTDSTINDNSAAIDGGGIYNGGTMTATNSTVSGNSAVNDAGGIYSDLGPLTLTNVTVTNNRADNDNNGSGTGGGILRVSNTVTLRNTIVALNFKGPSSSTRDDVKGAFTSQGHNLIGDGTGSTGYGATGDQVGTGAAPINPLLGALSNNGGTTLTHPLLYNSPAVDKGNDCVFTNTCVPSLGSALTTDQRGAGFARQANGDLTAGAVVDIGAYERQATETRAVPDGENVLVDLVDARLTFPCVPSGGCGGFRAKDAGTQGKPSKNNISPDEQQPAASITVIDPNPPAQPTPPPGYFVGNDVTPPLPGFDISTNVVNYDPPVTFCFYLPTINDQNFFNALKVLHREAGTNTIYGDGDDVLVDRTRAINPIDFPNRLVCAEVDSFSAFVIAYAPTPTAANGNVSGQIVDSIGIPVEGVGVRMTGTQNRLTVTDAAGNYRFDNVETNGFYTVVPTRANFGFSPAQRAFSQLGQTTNAAFNATSTGNALNPLDATEYFVRQQYVDFLGREPDETGFNFWVNNIESCGENAQCREAKRIDTSAAFFLSIEFQQTGYLVYRTHQAAYGDLPNAPVPINLNEFKSDTAKIGQGVVVLKTGWETVLENNKQAYAVEFVQRPRFVSAYPGMLTPSEFVDKLFTTAGVRPGDSDRSAAISEFGSAATSADVAARGRTLRRVAENALLAQQEFNQAFVLMEYFGYLRRNPSDAPEQTLDYTGYNFWLNKLNTFGGNFHNAEMVKAFLSSIEYRGRFPR